jgi:hypothetical protein
VSLRPRSELCCSGVSVIKAKGELCCSGASVSKAKDVCDCATGGMVVLSEPAFKLINMEHEYTKVVAQQPLSPTYCCSFASQNSLLRAYL